MNKSRLRAVPSQPARIPVFFSFFYKLSTLGTRLLTCLYLSVSARSTWTRRSTPTNPPRTTSISSTPAPVEQRSPPTPPPPLRLADPRLIKICWLSPSHSVWTGSRVINTCWHSDTLPFFFLSLSAWMLITKKTKKKNWYRLFHGFYFFRFVFSHISCYIGRVHNAGTVNIGPICGRSPKSSRPPTTHVLYTPLPLCCLCTPPTHHKEAHRHSGSHSPLFPFFFLPLTPPVPQRQCWKSVCFSKTMNISFFYAFSSLNWKRCGVGEAVVVVGGGSGGKSKIKRPRHPPPPRHMKSKGWVAVEWVSVCVHSFLIQKLTFAPPHHQHWQTQMFSSR